MEYLITIPNSTKEQKYLTLLPQLKALLEGETDTIANMANISAALKMTFEFFWVGFYIVKREELVLGPFQGTIACTRIKYGKGVCGTAWKEERTVIVDDVDQFPGHIACDAASRSEIVVPLFHHDEVIAVLDIDSEHLNHFDETDAHYLQQIVKLLESQL
nr:GAF domain-containing protein [Dysgonomonas hofstadii]